MKRVKEDKIALLPEVRSECQTYRSSFRVKRPKCPVCGSIESARFIVSPFNVIRLVVSAVMAWFILPELPLKWRCDISLCAMEGVIGISMAILHTHPDVGDKPCFSGGDLGFSK